MSAGKMWKDSNRAKSETYIWIIFLNKGDYWNLHSTLTLAESSNFFYHILKKYLVSSWGKDMNGLCCWFYTYSDHNSYLSSSIVVKQMKTIFLILKKGKLLVPSFKFFNDFVNSKLMYNITSFK